jgi:hypothetical protein
MNKSNDAAKEQREHVETLCKQAEAAAMYLDGLADAFALLAPDKVDIASHLRFHASALNMQPLAVRHGYVAPKASPK